MEDHTFPRFCLLNLSVSVTEEGRKRKERGGGRELEEAEKGRKKRRGKKETKGDGN